MLLLLVGVAARLGRVSDDPLVTYSMNPPQPQQDSALDLATQAANAAAIASSEAYTAAAERNTAVAAASAAQAELASYKSKEETQEKVVQATRAAKQAAQFARAADSSAHQARDLAEAMPAKIQAAAEAATAAVLKDAMKEMELEANATVATAKAENAKMVESAMKAASTAGLPYRLAEQRQMKVARDRVVQARDAAQAVIPLKNEAMKVVGQAVAYQAEGKVVPAQEMAIKGHDLMDKAVQLEGYAKGLMSQANSIQGNGGLYDLAAAGAENYAAYAANPVGSLPAIPALPAPLEMPSSESSA